ncbi:wd40 repeat-containing protein [Stylonychia lemnae]|uniref:Wd40 repeat-containing protein n=1 Tax=Stylonychia lemnae TaxID=5949 RepID=A0A078ABC2_STYLE|nr:wd40 repeat-containing protein [Stylonychia lemnae]|eukprot:CDW79600.1 wd40 repeat-containing protein [Stylonychia lemnae]
MTSQLKEPLLVDQPTPQEKSKELQELSLHQFTQLINNHKELHYQVHNETSYSYKKMYTKQSDEFERKHGLSKASFIVPTPKKNITFIVMDAQNIYQVLMKTEEKKQIESPESQTSVSAACASSCSLYLGFSKGALMAYSIKSGEWRSLPYNHDDSVRDIVVTPNEQYVITGSNDRRAFVYNLCDELMKTISFGGHAADLIVSKDSTLLFIGSPRFSKFIKVYETENFTLVDKIQLGSSADLLAFNEDENVVQFRHEYVQAGAVHEYKIRVSNNASNLVTLSQYPNCLSFSSDSKYLVFGAWDSTVGIWNFADREEIFRIPAGQQVNTALLTRDMQRVLTGGSPSSIQVWKLDWQNKSWELETTVKLNEIAGFGYVTCFILSNHDEKIAIPSYQYGKCFGIVNWETQRVQSVGPFDSEVYHISQNQDGSRLYLSLKNFTVLEWDFHEQKTTMTLDIHSNVMRALVTNDNSKLITAGEKLLIWDLDQKLIIKELEEPLGDIQDMMLSPSQKELYTAGFDKTLKVWDLDRMALLQTFVAETSRWCLAISENEEYIASTGWDYSIFLCQNALRIKIVDHNPENDQYSLTDLKSSRLTSQEISLYQSLIYKPENQEALVKQLSYQSQLYFPYNFSPLHVLVMNKNAEVLQHALRSGFIYTTDYLGKTPLTYALELGQLSCIDEIAQYLVNEGSNYAMTKEDFFLMFGSEIQSVRQLLGKVISPVKQNLRGPPPDFGEFQNERYAFQQYQSPSDDFVTTSVGDVVSGNLKEIQFLTSQIKLNLTPGSNESLKIMRHLATADPEIFRTNMKVIIDYKWSLFKKILQLQSFIYYVYLILVWLQILYNNAPVITAIVQVSTGLLLIYEGLQCYANSSYYLYDFWNYFDLSGFIILFLHCTFVQLGIEYTNDDVVRSFGIMVLCARGVSYLRSFDQSRYLVGMIQEIISDMASFFVVLIFALFALASIKTVLDQTDEITISEFLEETLTFYRIALGDWEVSDFATVWYLLVFICSTMLIPLILMNLLIALMGDTYARVQDSILPKDYALKAQLLWEVESLLSFKREAGVPQYFIVYKEAEHKDGGLKADGQVRQIKVNTMKILQKLTSIEKVLHQNK